jgi:hypothetical protein
LAPLSFREIHGLNEEVTALSAKKPVHRPLFSISSTIEYATSEVQFGFRAIHGI